MIDDVDAIGELEGHLGILLDEQHADPLALELPDGAHDGFHHERRQALRRLVQEEQLRPREEGADDGEHLLLAPGEQPSLAIQHLAELRKALEHALQGPARARPASDLQVLPRGEVGEDAARLGHEGDAELRDPVRGHPADGRALVRDGPARGRREAGDGAERRGLARAVPSQEGDHFALPDAEREPVQDVPEPVVRVDAPDIQDHGGAMPPR